MGEEHTQLRVEEAEGVDDTGGNEVVPGQTLVETTGARDDRNSPRRQPKVAVQEEEDHKHRSRNEMRDLEELVAHGPQWSNAREGQPRLCEESHNSSPVAHIGQPL